MNTRLTAVYIVFVLFGQITECLADSGLPSSIQGTDVSFLEWLVTNRVCTVSVSIHGINKAGGWSTYDVPDVMTQFASYSDFRNMLSTNVLRLITIARASTNLAPTATLEFSGKLSYAGVAEVLSIQSSIGLLENVTSNTVSVVVPVVTHIVIPLHAPEYGLIIHGNTPPYSSEVVTNYIVLENIDWQSNRLRVMIMNPSGLPDLVYTQDGVQLAPARLLMTPAPSGISTLTLIFSPGSDIAVQSSTNSLDWVPFLELPWSLHTKSVSTPIASTNEALHFRAISY